jgi:hypothetical protein
MQLRKSLTLSFSVSGKGKPSTCDIILFSQGQKKSCSAVTVDRSKTFRHGIPLLNAGKMTTKRINFLVETLKEETGAGIL